MTVKTTTVCDHCGRPVFGHYFEVRRGTPDNWVSLNAIPPTVLHFHDERCAADYFTARITNPPAPTVQVTQ